MKYTVTIEELVTIEVYVEADSVEEAEEKAKIGEYKMKEEINAECIQIDVHEVDE